MPATTKKPRKTGTEKASSPGDRLKTYREKRRFDVTPEPGSSQDEAPAEKKTAPAEPLAYVVQKHDARRLHYDVRLEVDGAMVSWAVPKGPSFDPAVRRLAVQTEDHPMAYNEFEGRIPDGEYGAGDVLIWDRGHLRDRPPRAAAGDARQGAHARAPSGGEARRRVAHHPHEQQGARR